MIEKLSDSAVLALASAIHALADAVRSRDPVHFHYGTPYIPNYNLPNYPGYNHPQCGNVALNNAQPAQQDSQLAQYYQNPPQWVGAWGDKT